MGSYGKHWRQHHQDTSPQLARWPSWNMSVTCVELRHNFCEWITDQSSLPTQCKTGAKNQASMLSTFTQDHHGRRDTSNYSTDTSETSYCHEKLLIRFGKSEPCLKTTATNTTIIGHTAPLDISHQLNTRHTGDNKTSG